MELGGVRIAGWFRSWHGAHRILSSYLASVEAMLKHPHSPAVGQAHLRRDCSWIYPMFEQEDGL